MTYIQPSEFVAKAINAGELKANLPLPIMVTRAFMAGSLLALAAVFALMVGHQTGYPIVGAALFPVGFCLIYLMGYDLVTGIFVLLPMAKLAHPNKVSWRALARCFGVVFLGNFAGALLVASIMATVFTMGFSVPPSALGEMIATIGESRTIGYKEHGIAGYLTVFLRAALCNWMVSTAVIGALVSTTVPGKVAVMWMPIMVFFAMTFEHSVVNMFLFPFALMLGGQFSISDYLIWNELPVILGNLAGGLFLTAAPLLIAHRAEQLAK